MTFEELLAQVAEVLQRRFALDDADLEDLKVELIEAKQLAIDENGRILVWAGKAETASPHATPEVQTPPEMSSHVEARAPETERRQLTVLFCDLVDSTVLASGAIRPH